MGIDVYGHNPSSETGEYFRNTISWWHPLAAYITCFGPQDVVSKCTKWHFNEGDGLGSEDALRLAAALQALIDSGHTERYRAELAARLPSSDSSQGCDEALETVWQESSVGFGVPNVQAFVNFLRDSGGFFIY